eukprot:TRINITY_DN26491_c0_g2_i1.p1 TRINITY_DN26491_c0_g2~~TRINITY_DN26491_c0_g2_i1.p1  ORF type:complete len:251 (-),score=51.89 TRINITY_DN26491_c0_g2_i1:133-858(-)
MAASTQRVQADETITSIRGLEIKLERVERMLQDHKLVCGLPDGGDLLRKRRDNLVRILDDRRRDDQHDEEGDRIIADCEHRDEELARLERRLMKLKHGEETSPELIAQVRELLGERAVRDLVYLRRSGDCLRPSPDAVSVFIKEHYHQEKFKDAPHRKKSIGSPQGKIEVLSMSEMSTVWRSYSSAIAQVNENDMDSLISQFTMTSITDNNESLPRRSAFENDVDEDEEEDEGEPDFEAVD